jgi:hypothetical protein
VKRKRQRNQEKPPEKVAFKASMVAKRQPKKEKEAVYVAFLAT